MTTATLDPVDIDLEPWWSWLATVLPDYCTHPFAAHHQDFWEWLWAITPGVRPEAFFGIWARGGAKSTSAEAACVALGARKKRRYGLYVCDTQDRADDHVGNVGAMLESHRVAMFYPDLATRNVGKYGNSRGWRRNRLWTAGGFVLDAIGLDTATRGVKLEDQRPDMLVVDDIDDRHDTVAATRRKIETLTESIIPAGSPDVAILGIQNLVKRDGVFDQVANGTAEFLRRRVVSGPVPAVRGLEVERGEDGLDHVTAGTPTWAGQDLAIVEAQINDWGYPAFLREAQHEVADAEGALVVTEQMVAARVDDFPDLDELVVSVDPSGGKGARHDDQGILAVGRSGVDGYVLEDHTCSLSPMGWGKKAVECAVALSADRIIVEDNFGGEMTANTIRTAADALEASALDDGDIELAAAYARFGSRTSGTVQQRNAKHSKKVRAQPCAALYGEKERPATWVHGRLHHVGSLPELEREWVTWEPEVTPKSPNRIDALAHAVADLGLVVPRGRRLRSRS